MGKGIAAQRRLAVSRVSVFVCSLVGERSFCRDLVLTPLGRPAHLEGTWCMVIMIGTCESFL